MKTQNIKHRPTQVLPFVTLGILLVSPPEQTGSNRLPNLTKALQWRSGIQA